MHPSDYIGKRVRVRTPHDEIIGRLRDLADWGTAGGGNYLLLAVDQPTNERQTENFVAVAMRHLELFEPLE